MDFKTAPGRRIHWARQHLANFTGLVGILNVTVYKAEPILTGLVQNKLFLFVIVTVYVISWLIVYIDLVWIEIV